MQNTFDRVVKISIYSLVFLLPLFFLPFSFEAFEFNKQYLLFFLVSLALFAWLAKMVLIDKEIKFKRTPLDVFVLGFLFVAILSAVFSIDRGSSLFGFYGRFSDGLIGLLSLGALYFLITNNIGSRENTEKQDAKQARREISMNSLIKTFLYSVSFVVLFSYFSIFGLWTKLNAAVGGALPQVMLQKTFNPASGSMEGLAILLSAIVVLTLGLFLYSRQNIEKIGCLGVLVLSLGLLAVIDYSSAWVVLLVSLSAFLVFALVMRIFKENVNKLLLPIFVIIVAATFLFVSVLTVQLPKEQVLDQRISWQTAAGAATENIGSVVLGSGIGTYFYNFSKFKPVEFNQNPLWQVRFDRPGSHFAEVLGTMGFLGLLSYLALIGLFLLISYFVIANSFFKSQAINPKMLPLLMIFLALVVGQFVYYQNTTLAFAFWLMLGLGAVCWQRPVKEKIISFKDFPELSLIFSTVVIVLGVAILGLYYFGMTYYLADANYSRGLVILGQERIEKIEKAVDMNPRSPQYRLALSRSFLFEVFQETQRPPAQQDESKMEAMIAESINEARIATDLQPNSAVNWNNLGIVYGEIIGIAGGAAEWGIWSLERAVALDPNNPVIYNELGKFYLVLDDKEKAREYFQKALEKKPDYAAAIVQEALLLEREDILDEAIARLENLIAKDPWNIEAYFQLGRLYYNAGRIDEAIELFEAVTAWLPQHSNALYSLGVAYVAKGQTQAAVEVFERVLELNPGNQDVINKLDNLRRQPKEEPEEELEEELEGEILE